MGYNWRATITNCYASGDVSGTGWDVGGLVGENERGTINNCYARGDVSGTTNVGGLVGYNGGWIDVGTITSSYSTGSVTGDGAVGGLVGNSDGWSHVSDSFWDIQTSGQTTSAGGAGKTTAELQTATTFIVWACEPVWTIDEGVDYPRLRWENMLGEPITTPSYGGGSGEPNDPYLIYTAEQLNEIGLFTCHFDKHFKLMADIDLAGFPGTAFNLIGYHVTWQDRKPFTGVFDGNGHTISNFTYDSNDTDYIGLFGYVRGSDAVIKELGLIDPNVDAGTGDYVGSLVGELRNGTITGCYVQGGSVAGADGVGGMVGVNSYGTISNCYSTGSTSGDDFVGGLVGYNSGPITNCYSEADVSGDNRIGGLVGANNSGTISNCYSEGNVSGTSSVGGLVGSNTGTITNCHSSADVSGNYRVGGLVAYNSYDGAISNCYSTGSVMGENDVGGLVGYNGSSVSASFWDIETSEQTTSASGTGKTTAEMQTESTFTGAGWDFTTPVWTINEGVDYPRLWWELTPVLHAEPEVTLGTSNTISWEPVPGANDYYAECAEDANFTSIIYNTGWITETSFEFTGLQLGRRYWYSVKARNIAGVESGWSNVESSLQVTLADAVDMMLDPESLRNENLKNALLNKINAVLQMLDAWRYEEALNKLQNDILAKMNGCAETGRPDKNDWIITCQGQGVLYPLVIETIENVKGLMQ